ncbi:hypothetical protein T440DRAFT_359084, partial [Plenodomus tracheiphilus IPT5]
MSLLGLPNELLSSILRYLKSERNINAFAQTNKYLYRLFNTSLYVNNIQQSGSSALLWAAQHSQVVTAQKLL